MDKWILEKRVIHCINTENRAVVLIQLHKQKILVTMEGEFLRSEKLANTLQLICQSGLDVIIIMKI
jgi:hypothetical protein